jgi:excisionase family DNA binding protein
MTVAELIERYETLANEAEAVHSTAPLEAVYRRIADELKALGYDVVGPGKLLTTREAARYLGLKPATVRKRCRAGRYPGARLTSGDTGDWRIPLSDIRNPVKPRRSRDSDPTWQRLKAIG